MCIYQLRQHKQSASTKQLRELVYVCYIYIYIYICTYYIYGGWLRHLDLPGLRPSAHFLRARDILCYVLIVIYRIRLQYNQL